MELQERLLRVQSNLKAPKNQRNNFGKYNYRSCEDILEALKPLLLKEELTLVINDEVKEIAGYMFIEAVATISYKSEKIEVKAQAGIDPNRKGMDISQTFGSSSSYARKYALNGLFLIDETESDADSQKPKDEQKEVLTSAKFEAMINTINDGNSDTVLKALPKYTVSEQQMKAINIAIEKNKK